MAPAALAGTYYVDGSNPGASDSGPGTSSQPFKTISAAVAQKGSPGNTLLVLPSVYRERVQITAAHSGIAGSPLTIRATAPGAKLLGSEDRSGTAHWSLVTGNVYLASDVTWSPMQVFLDGARLAASTAAPASLPANSFEYVSGSGLYVNGGGGNPGLHALEVGYRTHAVTLNGSYVVLDGFEMSNTEDHALQVGSDSMVTVQNCTVRFAKGHGIDVNTCGSVNVLQSISSDNLDHGIYLNAAHDCVVRGNTSYNNVRPNVRAANGIDVNASIRCTIDGNRCHDNQDSGIQFYTGSDDCVSRNNMSWNNGDHGYDHLHSVRTRHSNDLAYGNYKDGFSLEGSASGCVLYNCIAVDNGLTSDEFDLWVDSTSVSGFTSDRNLFWNSNAQQPIKFRATRYAELSDYAAASGQDSHSVQADPRFVTPATGDFRLSNGSPAIDHGTSLSADWPPLDIDGEARLDDPLTPNSGVGPVTDSDLGPLEYVPLNADHPPVMAAPASFTGSEAAPMSFVVHAADPDGDAITSLVGDGLPPGASFTAAPGDTTGTFAWTPGYSDSGSHVVRFIASNVLADTVTTVIHVLNVDRAPIVAAPESVTVVENSTLSLVVHAADPDGDAIASLVVAGLPQGASFTTGPLDTTATLVWTPSSADSGLHAVTFKAQNALSESTTTVIRVRAPDRAPVVAAPESVSVVEGGSLGFVVHAVDPDGEAIAHLAGSTLPPGSSFTPEAGGTSGTFTWSPGYADSGTYRVVFTATNALAGSDTTTIHVLNVDRAPILAAPDTATVEESAALSFVVHAADPDGDPIASLDASGLPAHATFTADSGDSTATLSWTPGYGDTGTYLVRYQAANALVADDSTMILVRHHDRAPVVSGPDSLNIAEGDSIHFTVHAFDPDGEPIASLGAIDPPPGAIFTPDAGDTSGVFAWAAGYADSGVHRLVFRAVNALAGSDTTLVRVWNVDRGPAIVAPESLEVSEGGALSFVFHAGDPDGDPMNLSANGLPPGASFTPDSGDTTGVFAWTPGYADSGTYRFTFHATNALAESASTVIHVMNVDRAPVVAAPASLTVFQDQPTSFVVHAVDLDGDAIASLAAIDLPPGATFTSGTGDSTGSFQWTPAAGDTGIHGIMFVASNALAESTVTTIRVRAPDRAPVIAAPESVSAFEGGAVSFVVHSRDPDGDPIDSLVAIGLPGGASFTAAAGDTSGSFAWTPGYADAGRYTVTFRAANALAESVVTVIQVANVDRAPIVAAPESVMVMAGAALSFGVHALDPDGDAIAALAAEDVPAGATFLAGPADTTGTFTWTPAEADSGVHAIRFRASNALAESVTTTIRVLPPDHAPLMAAPESVSVLEGGAVSFAVHALDPDGDPIASLVAVGVPNGASFNVSAGDTVATFVWTTGYADSGRYTVRFRAANALAESATTVIQVANVDRAPIVAAPESVTVDAGAPLSFVVHALDPDGDPIASLAANGMPVSAGFQIGPADTTGTFTWTPAVGDTGAYVVRFVASNALVESTTTTIRVVISNHPPTVSAPVSRGIYVGVALSFAVHATDADGEPIAHLTASGMPAGASFTASAGETTGTFTWTPSYGDSGDHVVTFTAANGLSGSARTSITVVVGSNLVTNPGFETNLSGWGPNGGPTLSRVSPGHGGSFCLQAVTTGSTTYGITDNPNLITNVTAVGVMYHLTAWVRSPSSHGAAKIKVREFANGTQQGNSAYSNGFTLTTAWQQISFDYSTRKAGSYLDIEINDYPVSSGETIQIDDIAITRTAVAGVEDGHGASFAASLSPNPMRSGGELRFTITRPGPVRVDLYDLAGRRVASPLNASYLPAGRHAVTFTTALQLSAGCYFYRLEAVEGARQGRFVILE